MTFKSKAKANEVEQHLPVVSEAEKRRRLKNFMVADEYVRFRNPLFVNKILY